MLSVFGMTLGQFLFHWALDFASVVQVATLVTVMPIAVVFAARLIEGTPVTVPKMISGVGAFLGCLLFVYRLCVVVLGLVERAGCSAWQLPFLSQARDCRHSRVLCFGRTYQRYSVTGNRGYHRFRHY